MRGKGKKREQGENRSIIMETKCADRRNKVKEKWKEIELEDSLYRNISQGHDHQD